MAFFLEIAKWKHNAMSPIVFMIDDLANIYIKKNSLNEVCLGEDWGHFGFKKNSMWNFLENNLYKNYPHIKTTFFLVVGKREPMIKGQEYSYSGAIDKNEEFKNFLQTISKNKNIEIAYHGTTHGKAGNGLSEFKQEWETFENLQQATETILQGKELFKEVLGFYPKGGKYCGYKKGLFGDESINTTGFEWWCRDWDATLETKIDDSLSYDCEYFGNVIDIPSSVDGSLYSLKNLKFNKKYLSSIRHLIKYKTSLENKINQLYTNRQLISIQEHSSPYRTDERLQYPNIVSDIKNLKYVFKLLSKFDVWHATATEVADYFRAYFKTDILFNNNQNEFTFDFNDKLIENTEITLVVDNSIKSIQLNNFEYFAYQKNSLNLVDLPIKSNSTYRLVIK